MSARISTILIIGAGGGIGEALARRFYTLGKRVIVTGREEDVEILAQLSRDLPGLEYRVWDLTHLDRLKTKVKGILTDFPNLDSVFVNAGVQYHYDIFQHPPPDDIEADVVRELTTNLTAPILVAQAFAPHLLELARSGSVKTNLFLTSSTLAYFPVPFYPTYCPAKAGIASFAKILRMQLASAVAGGADADMNVVEVVPPYVDTPLNAAHRDQTDALQGGKEKAVQPMPLSEYIEQFFAALEQTKPDGSFRDEIGVGFGALGAAIWNEGYQKLLKGSGMTE